MKTMLDFFKSTIFIRILTFIVLILVLFSLKGLMNLLLFTFIFIVLMGNIQSFISNAVEKYIPISRRFVVIILYLLILLFLIMVFYKYLPIVAMQVTELVRRLIKFYQNPPDNYIIQFITNSLNKVVDPKSIDVNWIAFTNVFKGVMEVFTQLLISLILSLFYLLGKDHVARFSSTFRTSQVGWFFVEVEYLGRKFINSFGKVIEVQFLIAFINASLTTIALWILGFPQLLGLGLMIFFLGLIPVAGVFISLIPLSIIAYSIGGGIKILYVLILILFIHALESYILNPKLMSVKTHVPVFYTFIVLLISEHFLGIWGLILGIPIFIFILDVIGVNYINKASDS